MTRPTALVRRPGPRLADGLVTHLDRTPVDVDLARAQWEAYGAALRIEAHQVNAWNFAHGGILATMAEIGTAQAAWDPDGPACVAIDLAIQFIGAPKLGDVLEVCGTLTKRTRSLVFASARGEVAGAPVFFATSIQKIVGS